MENLGLLSSFRGQFKATGRGALEKPRSACRILFRVLRGAARLPDQNRQTQQWASTLDLLQVEVSLGCALDERPKQGAFWADSQSVVGEAFGSPGSFLLVWILNLSLVWTMIMFPLTSNCWMISMALLFGKLGLDACFGCDSWMDGYSCAIT